MPFQLSPGVAVVEKDFTSIVPAVATSIGAFAGQFDWGPVLEPITISSEDDLVRRFGTPNNSNFQSWFTAANFLSYSNNLLLARQKTTNMKNAVVTPSGGLSSISLDNAGYGYISTQPAPAVVIHTAGLIKSVTVLTGGTGYTSAPTVTINDTTGHGAAATASINSTGQVIGISITKRGYGYTNPSITLTGAGSGATFSIVTETSIQEEGGTAPSAYAVLSGGGITGITLGNNGTGYTSAPTVSIIPAAGDQGTGASATAVLSGGPIQTITLTSGGANYVSPVVNITGGGGTGAVAHAVVSSGVITSIVVDAGGSGYISNPTVTITDSGGGSGYVINTITRGTSTVTSITINNAGGGYRATPTVTLSGGTSGTPATVGSVTIGPSTLLSVQIVEPGTGLFAVPTISIAAPPVGGTQATATSTINPLGVAIYNGQFYSANFINGAGVVGEWAAKYPGKLGNTLKVSMADRDTYSTWVYKNEFDAAPGTSESCARIGGSNDEMHIIVIDEKGFISGVENAVLEKYAFVSKASDNKKPDGTNNYYKDVINGRSEWLWWMDHTNQIEVPVADSNWGSLMAGTDFHSMTTSLTQSLSGGFDDAAATDAQTQEAYQLFSNAELYDVSLIMCGKANANIVNYVIDNIALERLDSVVFASPEDMDTGEVIIGDNSEHIQSIIDFRNALSSNSYSVLDSGYKYQYDRYNDVYRWVPLNGDIAGLCARTDYTNDPWWSPGGLNRGQVKNVVRLSTNPNQTNRDTLYRNSVNPVVTFPGQGTVLFGDKTLLSKPSAFDRINVRRLFIVLEKSIATAAKYQLFEFNDAFTRGQFKNLIEPFLRDVQGRRGITDFLVKCDESNNTGEVIDRNEFVADIFVKPTRSINFITLNFVASRSSIAFSEIGG
jgi:phage tail sheath protein FI